MDAISIKYKDVELDINYDYSPPEKQTRDHPGCHAEVEVCEIFFNGSDVTDIYFSLSKEDEIASEIINKLDN